jgi:hypothetical protein
MSIRENAYDQNITELFGLPQVTKMTDMEPVEHSMGLNNLFPPGTFLF